MARLRHFQVGYKKARKHQRRTWSGTSQASILTFAEVPSSISSPEVNKEYV